ALLPPRGGEEGADTGRRRFGQARCGVFDKKSANSDASRQNGRNPWAGVPPVFSGLLPAFFYGPDGEGVVVGDVLQIVEPPGGGEVARLHVDLQQHRLAGGR